VTIAGVAFWPIWPIKGGQLQPTYWRVDRVDGRHVSLYVDVTQPGSLDNDCIGRIEVVETPESVEIVAYRRVHGHHCSRHGCTTVNLEQPLGDRSITNGQEHSDQERYWRGHC
jgi:hypothetical protein